MAYSKPYLREYWTPNLAQILFWGYAVLVGIGAGLAFAGGQWLAAALCIAAIFAVRMLIETTLVAFEIRNLLTDIRDQKPEASPNTRLAAIKAQSVARTAPGEMRME